MSEERVSGFIKFSSKLRISFLKRFNRIIHGRVFVKKIDGISYLIDTDNYIDKRMLAWKGGWENSQIEYFFSKATELGVEHFFDVGSCWGLYALRAKLHYGIASVTAFEPDSVNRAQLFGNLFLNNCVDTINVCSYAASNQMKKVNFSRDVKTNRGGNAIDPSGNIEIECRTIDSQYNIRSKQIAVKLDVEGHEMEALEGMTEILNNNSGILQIETGNAPEVSKYLGDYGWRYDRNFNEDVIFIK